MRGRCRLVLLVTLAAVLVPVQAIAEATVPTKDIVNACDNPVLRRYDGSFIVDYAQKEFDEFELPTASLSRRPARRTHRTMTSSRRPKRPVA